MSCRTTNRRGAAAIVMILVLVIAELIIVGAVLGSGRDGHLTVRRVDTIREFYASEAGMQMAIREIDMRSDEDGDGAVGTISDDATDANDPAFGGGAYVVVTATCSGADKTLISRGRAGDTIRRLEAGVE